MRSEIPDSGTEEQLKLLRSELHSALAAGNRQKLEQLLDESFVFVHSTGRVETRSEFIDRAVESSAHQRVPELLFAQDQIRVFSGTAAVWISHSTRKGTSISFVGTDVLVKRAGTWKWVSVHSTRTDH
jgi:hypothetical protein